MAKIPRSQIAAVLAERSLGRFDASQFSEQIAAYLMQEHRIAELEPLLRDIITYRAKHGIVEVIATSAHQLTPAVRTDIETEVKRVYPNAKRIIVSEDLQPAVIGGVRLAFPDRQLDMTVRAKLSKFKQLTNGRTK